VNIITDSNTYSDKISWSNFHGGAQRRMSQEEVESKFLRLAQPVIGKTNAAEILHICRSLERVKDIKSLTRHFSAG
jgi:hypothetical protein